MKPSCTQRTPSLKALRTFCVAAANAALEHTTKSVFFAMIPNTRPTKTIQEQDETPRLQLASTECDTLDRKQPKN